MKTSILENLEKAKFTGEETKSTIEYNLGKDNGYTAVACDNGLPPGCDCICNQPCDFGIIDTYKSKSKEL